MPSGFLVVFEKPNRSSFSFTFTSANPFPCVLTAGACCRWWCVQTPPQAKASDGPTPSSSRATLTLAPSPGMGFPPTLSFGPVGVPVLWWAGVVFVPLCIVLCFDCLATLHCTSIDHEVNCTHMCEPCPNPSASLYKLTPPTCSRPYLQRISRIAIGCTLHDMDSYVVAYT